MPPCSPLSSTSPAGRANCACLTGTVRGSRACAWAGAKERPPQRPNKGTGSRRRMTLRQPLSYRDPNTEPLHENGASPTWLIQPGGTVVVDDVKADDGTAFSCILLLEALGQTQIVFHIAVGA